MDDQATDLLIDNDLFEEYEEEIFYDCYNCNWVGKDPYLQQSDLWPEEFVYLCPECGELLSD